MITTATSQPFGSESFLGRYWKAKAVFLLLCLILVFTIGMNLDKFRMFIGFYKILIGQPDPAYCCYYWANIEYQTTDWLMQKLQVWSHIHTASMRFRLVPPALYTVFNSALALYTVQVLLGIAYLYMVLDEAYRILKNRLMAFLFAAGFAGLYAGAAFILDVSGFCDAFAFTFMMGAIYFRNPLPIFLCVFLAAWVDERAVFNLTLVVTYHLLAPYRKDLPVSFNTLASFRPTKQIWAIIAGCLAYLAIRFFLIYRYDLSSPTGGDTVFFNVFNAFKTIGFRFWSGFEGFWLLLSAMLLLVWKQRQYLLFWLLAGLTCVTTFTLLMQGDYIRTISFGFPLLFIALVITNKGLNRRDLFWILAAIVLTSTLLYPVPY